MQNYEQKQKEWEDQWEERSLLERKLNHVPKWIGLAAKTGRANIRSVTDLNLARVAVAAERFRLASGRWPESLAELAPAYIDAIPGDLYDGGPLRLRRSQSSHEPPQPGHHQ